MGGKHREDPDETASRGIQHLPPQPDPDTGHPFPPEAPAYRGRPVPEGQERGPMAGTPPKRARPPGGMGRTLAWVERGRNEGIKNYLVSFAIVFVGSGIVTFLDSGQLDFFKYWQLWLILVVGAWLMGDPLERLTVSAGADWVQWQTRPKWYQRRRERVVWLKTYRLIEIHGCPGVVSTIRVFDEDGRGTERRMSRMQQDRRIWDLFYNGIVHSVANGADIDHLAAEMLYLGSSDTGEHHTDENDNPRL